MQRPDVNVRKSAYAMILNNQTVRPWQKDSQSEESESSAGSVRKEVIQPQVLLQLPCYDFTPVMNHTVGAYLLPKQVGPATSSTAHSRDVTGGVYKARERIHRGVLIRDY